MFLLWKYTPLTVIQTDYTMMFPLWVCGETALADFVGMGLMELAFQNCSRVSWRTREIGLGFPSGCVETTKKGTKRYRLPSGVSFYILYL